MARQIFFRGEAGPARINVPQAPNIAGAGSVLNGRSPLGDLLRVADEGGRKIAGGILAIVGRRMDGHVEDAYIEARRRFAEWQASYNRTHQASQGLDAQADYSLQWNKIAKDIREEYGGYLEGSWHRKLDRKLELGRLYATVDGARWQDQQFGAWGANQEKVQLSNFDRLVQGSPDDLARIQMEKAELVRAWRERNPGMDSTVFERGLDEGIAAGRVQALLARGDIDGAQAALTRYGSAGGDWNRGVAAEAQRRRGTPHGGVGSSNDCSAYTGAIWRPYISDPKIRQAIFGPDGGRSTSENIVQETARRTQGGRTLGNGELAPGRVGPGMVIGLDTGQHAHDRGRRLGIDHIVSTYMGADGRLMVTESSSDKRPGGGVHDTPYEEWYARNKGHKLYGASLVPLLQGGSAGGGAPAGWQEYSGPRGSSIAEKNHNPGNIRHNGRDYDHYASDAEGWLDMASVLRKPGYADLTVQQIAERYVNGKVGQSVVPEYLKAIQAQGFSLGEKPNLQDSQVLARLMKGMAMGESPLGQKYSVEQIHGLISGGAQSHAQAAPVKMSPDVKETYDAFMEQVNKGLMPRERLEGLAGEWAQDKSPKVARRGREILAALRQSQPQAGAPAAQAVQQPAYGAGRPSFGGGILSPDKAGVFQRQIDQARERQARDALIGLAGGIWQDAMQHEDPEERQAAVMRGLKDVPQDQQAQVLQILQPQMAMQDKMDQAASAERLRAVVPQLKGLNRLEVMQTVNMMEKAGTLKAGEGAKAVEVMFGKRQDSPETRAAARHIREEIDEGRIKTREQVEAACFVAGCTDAQIHDTLGWLDQGGSSGKLSVKRIEELWRRVREKGTNERMPDGLDAFVRSVLPVGREATEQDIMRAIGLAYIEGRGLFSDFAFQASAKGKYSDFTPAHTDEDYESAVKLLRARGVKGTLTDVQISAALREMKGLPADLTKRSAR